jgi:peptidoglycan/xylan/chitin deacetylase (PgdA/CDA1 family)
LPAPVIALHHHIGAESEFELGLNIATRLERFEQQVAWMAKDFDFVDEATLIDGPLPRKPLLLTFDDAYLSVLEVARDILAPRGISSLYFINPGLLGKDAISLDCTLAWGANKIGIEALCQLVGASPHPHVGSLIVNEMCNHGATAREAIKQKVLAELGPPDLGHRAPVMEEADLAALPKYRVAIGNHSMNHVHCRSLNGPEIEQEIVLAKAKLEALSGTRVRSFSIPYGHEDDMTPQILAAIRSSGHDAIHLVHSRSNAIRPAPDIWYRTSLHDELPGELRAHLTWKPLMRSIKHRLFG